MISIPQNLQRYSKFIRFVWKYWNSSLFQQAASNAIDATPAEKDSENNNSDVDYTKPEELVEDLKNMGPTYVKLGQLLSTRPDLLPDDYLQALTQLQDDVAVISFDDVKNIVEEEIGVRLSKAFEHFEEKPLAAASIGQVHKAVLRSGKQVAVKIQRSGVRKNFVDDLDTLQEVAAFADKHSKMARKYGLEGILEELRHILLNELDYTKEAQNLVILGNNLKDFPHLLIPQPISEYSSSRVLTMEFVEGQKITSVNPLLKTEQDFTPIIDNLVKAYLKQIIVDGFAHADPHPGNVHLTRDHKVALMDLGMVAKFSNGMQEHLLKLLFAMSQNDGDKITDTLLNISDYEKDVNLDSFKKNINRLVMSAQSRTAKDLQTGRLLIQMNRIAADEGIRIAVELNILGKILLNMDQIVATLTPQYDLQAAICKHVQSMMEQKMQQELKPENMLNVLVETKKLTQNLPERLNKITERLANNTFELKIDAIDEKRFTDGFQKVANRITIGLIVAAMIIGAAMLMRVPTTFTIWGYPALAMLFFLLAAIAGIAILYTIVFRDEDFKKKLP